MIKFFEGTVFNTNSEAIVNTVNCDGFMGAGLALEFALRYPKMLEDYEQKCQNKQIKVGVLDTFREDNTLLINFPTKNSFKYPSQIKWVEDGLKYFVQNYEAYNIKTVAFPKLGCSNGGLDWNEVKNLMVSYLSDIDITVYICTDEIKEAQGKEKNMLDSFNNCDLYELGSQIKLNEKQINALKNRMPYNRFWMIEKTASIGKTTYKKLFQHFYNESSKQIKLF